MPNEITVDSLAGYLHGPLLKNQPPLKSDFLDVNQTYCGTNYVTYSSKLKAAKSPSSIESNRFKPLYRSANKSAVQSQKRNRIPRRKSKGMPHLPQITPRFVVAIAAFTSFTGIHTIPLIQKCFNTTAVIGREGMFLTIHIVTIRRFIRLLWTPSPLFNDPASYICCAAITACSPTVAG